MRQLAACIPEIAAGPPEIYFHFLHLLLPPLHTHNIEKKQPKLDPIGSTMRYEVMNFCTGSV